MMKGKLTPRQVRFVEEYLIDLNAAQAAIRAGYSKKTARQIGQHLLTKVDIAEAVEKAKAERSERTEVTQDWVVDRLKDVHEASMKESERGGVYNPTAANRSLELLGKHVGMFKEGRVEGDISITVNMHPHGSDGT